MKFFKGVLVTGVLLFLLAGSCLFYAFKIEPYRLKVNQYDVTEKEAGKRPVKIVQFSDLHMKEDFTARNLEKIVNTINGQNPDIVLFTGDLYDNYAKYNDDENVIAALNQITARYAKIAVWGNRDYGGGAVRQYENIMGQAGFVLLRNEHDYVTVEDNKRILVTGLDDALLGDAYMPDPAEIYDSDYQILLSHEPDKIEEYRDYNYDLTLSGHSHGGQVNIPFLPFINEKAVSVTSLSSKYVKGMYFLEPGGGRKLYVNTGIGTTHISARFGVVPEVSVFLLYI